MRERERERERDPYQVNNHIWSEFKYKSKIKGFPKT